MNNLLIVRKSMMVRLTLVTLLSLVWPGPQPSGGCSL